MVYWTLLQNVNKEEQKKSGLQSEINFEVNNKAYFRASSLVYY